MGSLTVFYLLAFFAIVCSLLVVISKNPVASAIYLVVDLFILAGIYASLNAHFVAAIQIVIYTGAVVVLFVFVIMLLNLAPDQKDKLGLKLPDIGFTLLVAVSFLIMTALLVNEQPSSEASGPATREAIAQIGGNTYAVALTLFSKYVWPFELASFLILAAIIGSVLVAKKDKKQNPTQAPLGEKQSSAGNLNGNLVSSPNTNPSSQEKAAYGSP